MLTDFAILAVCAKLTKLRLPYYAGALLAVAGMRFAEHRQAAGFFVPHVFMQLAVAMVLFFLMNRNERHFWRWLFWFGVSFVVLVLVL
jgi:hypothetical protein